MNIVITGASGGIGTAIALKLNEHNLALQYNNTDIAEDLSKHFSIKCNLTNESETKAMFSSIINEIGDIDVLINNCGISYFSLLQDMNLAKWNEVMAVNMSSAFLCTKEVIPSMLKKGGGHIVNISSVWGQCGASCEAAYSASKGAMISFTKAMAQELAPSNILVNCVCPGFIDTAMNNNLSEADKIEFIKEIPLGRAGTGEDIAKTVEFLINQTYITGQVIAVNGGLYI